MLRLRSGDLEGGEEYPFISLTSRSTQTRIGSTGWGPMYVSNRFISKFSFSWLEIGTLTRHLSITPKQVARYIQLLVRVLMGENNCIKIVLGSALDVTVIVVETARYMHQTYVISLCDVISLKSSMITLYDDPNIIVNIFAVEGLKYMATNENKTH